MYVVRWQFRCKWEKDATLVEALKAITAAEGTTGRIYSYVFGEVPIVISEVEFPDVESAARHRDNWKRGIIKFKPGINQEDFDLDGLGFHDAVVGMTVEMLYVEAVTS